jgi:hypothetical protein
MSSVNVTLPMVSQPVTQSIGHLNLSQFIQQSIQQQNQQQQQQQRSHSVPHSPQNSTQQNNLQTANHSQTTFIPQFTTAGPYVSLNQLNPTSNATYQTYPQTVPTIISFTPQYQFQNSQYSVLTPDTQQFSLTTIPTHHQSSPYTTPFLSTTPQISAIPSTAFSNPATPVITVPNGSSYPFAFTSGVPVSTNGSLIVAPRTSSDVTHLFKQDSKDDGPKKPRSMHSAMLSRSASIGPQSVPMDALQWREHISFAERVSLRQNLRAIYASQISSRKELLDIISALQEEFIYAHSTNRISYFKQNISAASKINQYGENAETVATMIKLPQTIVNTTNTTDDNMSTDNGNSSSIVHDNNKVSSSRNDPSNTISAPQSDADAAAELLALRSAASPPPSSDNHPNASSV